LEVDRKEEKTVKRAKGHENKSEKRIVVARRVGLNHLEGVILELREAPSEF